jgi:hypothetical protein
LAEGPEFSLPGFKRARLTRPNARSAADGSRVSTSARGGGHGRTSWPKTSPWLSDIIWADGWEEF